MSLILNGTTGISDVDGTAAAPALTGTDSNTGIFFPAADTIAFAEGGVEAMRIDSSGRVGIGTTSPTGFLNVDGTGGDALPATSGSTQSAGLITRLQQGGAIGSVMDIGGNGGSGSWIQVTEASNLATNYNLLLNPNGGNLLVGTTSATGRLTLAQDSASSAAAFINASSASYSGNVCDVRTGTAAGTGYTLFAGTANSSTVFQVLGNGNVRNTNNSYGAISDTKLKENVTEATPKLDKLNQVRVVNFNLIGKNHKQIGVIAQELEKIFPGMVEETPDRDAEGNDLGTVTKAVKYSVFVPMLIKAIQEQQALITALTTRITALEGAA